MWNKASKTGIEDTLPAPKINVILDLLFLNLLAKPLNSFICSKLKFFPNLTSPSKKGNRSFSIVFVGNTL